jgi:multidrug efflux pump subunit AcrA (membrane-fusion protein)
MTAHQSIRRHLLVIIVAVVILVGGIGGWAYTSEFAGAVIAQGQLVVDTSVKKVQHPSGGVVAELKVRDGDQVKAGEVVIRLDDTQTRANLAIVSKGLDELRAPRARKPSWKARTRSASARSPRAQGRAGGRPPDQRRNQAVRDAAQDARRPEAAARRAGFPVGRGNSRRSLRWPRRKSSANGCSRSSKAFVTCGARSWCSSNASPRWSASRLASTASADS